MFFTAFLRTASLSIRYNKHPHENLNHILWNFVFVQNYSYAKLGSKIHLHLTKCKRMEWQQEINCRIDEQQWVESSITHSQWTQSCASPSKFVLTVNEHQWTLLCSQSSLQRDKSGRCEDPYPKKREENPHRMLNKYINSHQLCCWSMTFSKEFCFMVHHTYMCAQKHILYCWSYHCS